MVPGLDFEGVVIIQTLNGTWNFRQSGTQEWHPAVVPGGVHTDLLAAGLIPDPFAGDNELRVQWVTESGWEYATHFDCPPELLSEERIFMVCDGLDTLATLSLNGQVLGHTDNMFRQYQWEVKSTLRTQGNSLVIHFESPVKYAREKQASRPLVGVSQGIPGAPHLRKAPCQFGWDWGPQLPPIGIWKEIRLEGYRQARLKHIHLRQEHEAGQVIVEARVIAERWKKVSLEA